MIFRRRQNPAIQIVKRLRPAHQPSLPRWLQFHSSTALRQTEWQTVRGHARPDPQSRARSPD